MTKKLTFTGERFIPGIQGDIELEHLHRYAIANELVTGKTILDIACGEGYGSAILASSAKHVIGVDISEKAIDHAKSTYKKQNIKFLHGTCANIPLEDNSVEVVVSFETIEHISEQVRFLEEIHRVLKPSGLLILSSPNRPIYNQFRNEPNPYHVRELEFNELNNLLKKHFQYIKFAYQRPIAGSSFLPTDVFSKNYLAYTHKNSKLIKRSANIEDAVYYFAICSENKATLPKLKPSIVLSEQFDPINEHLNVAKWAQSLEQDLLKLTVDLEEERSRRITLTKTNSWRLTLPLRETRRWISSQVRQIKRYTKEILRKIKQIYQALPLNYQTKIKYRCLLAKILPSVLTASDTPPATISSLSVPKTTFPRSINYDARIDPTKNHYRSRGMVIPFSYNPLVSVIIPVYGKIEYTLHCLESIAAHLPKCSFEVIIVDDCSPDNTVDVLKNVQGIQLIENEENQGFIRSCNKGAAASHGEYLLFLNNDTEVTPGWLDALLRTFHDFPGTGLAGSKLVYPDGRLQEAGGIIWKDGSAWNFGRLQDPNLPIYNYAREVDYCSGASIMLPSVLFNELSGFDEYYLPAYCEDSDLALKIREKGYRVIYQPLSTVIHFEGITSGTDTSKGTKTYQVKNSKKLFDRWKQRLETHQAPGVDVENAKDRKAKQRVLVLDHCTPTPDQDAGSVTVFNLLLLLREMNFQVTFIPENNFLYLPGYTTALQRAGIEMLYTPYVNSVRTHLKASGKRYDLAFLFRPSVVARHIKTLRKHCPNTKVLFHTIDLHCLRLTREAQLQSDQAKQKAADDMQKIELDAINSVDASIVHSTVELDMFQPLVPEAKLHVFPLILNTHTSNKSFKERKDIVFVGSYQHTPNVDAVNYFVENIMPRLRQHLPGVRFYIIGSKPPKEIKKMACKDVIVTGFVEDLLSLLNKVRISVAPLRYGAGIKGKIGTAMAAGLPVVATSVAVEGMSLTNGENILVADKPDAFAKTITRLYQDANLWKKISAQGLDFAEKTWGTNAAWAILSDILSDLDIKVTKGNMPLSLYTSIEDIHAESNPVNTTKWLISKHKININELPEIYHYWSEKHLKPILNDAGFSTIDSFFSSSLLMSARRTDCTKAHFLSVGSGNCDLEVSIARNLLDQGFDNFTLTCLELNPVMLSRGQEIAKEKDVIENMLFIEDDFNTWQADREYHGNMANQSLHHVTELEHLFDQIKHSLHPEASFVISDVIGRNGHQRWPEALKFVNKYWKKIPPSKKYNALLDRFETEYENWDCSKEGANGIRAQDILPLLVQRFECEKFIGFGNVIDVFIDRCFGHNFNPHLQDDREFIDKIHAEDEAGFENGFLKPTHMIAVFSKNLHGKPFFSRGIDPVSSIRNPNDEVDWKYNY